LIIPENKQNVSPINPGEHGMPLSSAVRERCRAFLPPGEELRYLFPATSVQMGRSLFAVAPFLVAIADTQVIVLSCRWFRRNVPKSVWARYPRAIQLGPVDTSLAPTFTIGDLVLETDEEYVAVIRAADAETSATDYLPPDPLPDL
jgi:hypothetical protein